jgi:hypothetical protein
MSFPVSVPFTIYGDLESEKMLEEITQIDNLKLSKTEKEILDSKEIDESAIEKENILDDNADGSGRS